jgi:hypothetical protein
MRLKNLIRECEADGSRDDFRFGVWDVNRPPGWAKRNFSGPKLSRPKQKGDALSGKKGLSFSAVFSFLEKLYLYYTSCKWLAQHMRGGFLPECAQWSLRKQRRNAP